MEIQSHVLFDFLKMSYQRGLVDDVMAMGDLLDPNMDTGEMLDSFDDAIAAMDLGPAATMFQDQIKPLLQSLTNPEAIDALHAIMKATRPYLTALTQGGGQSNSPQNVQMLVALVPHLPKLLKHLVPLAKPYVQPFLEDSGNLIGRALNAMSAAIIKSHARDPQLVGRIFKDLFSTLDAMQFREAMKILAGGFIDQRPKLLRWPLNTILIWKMKRFARSKRG